jgi:hypothetical protein
VTVPTRGMMETATDATGSASCTGGRRRSSRTCLSEVASELSMGPRLLPRFLAISTVTLAACAGQASGPPAGALAPDGIFLPRLTGPQDSWPAALTSGKLVEKHGCVFLMPGDVLLIWPNEARADRTSGGALRVTVGGKLVGETGDEVQLGGGFVGESMGAVNQVERLIGEPIPERCHAAGGYWLTAPRA